MSRTTEVGLAIQSLTILILKNKLKSNYVVKLASSNFILLRHSLSFFRSIAALQVQLCCRNCFLKFHSFVMIHCELKLLLLILLLLLLLFLFIFLLSLLFFCLFFFLISFCFFFLSLFSSFSSSSSHSLLFFSSGSSPFSSSAPLYFMAAWLTCLLRSLC